MSRASSASAADAAGSFPVESRSPAPRRMGGAHPNPLGVGPPVALGSSLVLHAAGIGRHHGGQVVLADISLTVDRASRTGVVGRNGVGKSTLLRILAGLEAPDAGTVRRAPASATVGYLPQESDAHRGEVLLDYLARRTGAAAATARLEATSAALADAAPGADDAYAEALETWLALGGADLEARAGA